MDLLNSLKGVADACKLVLTWLPLLRAWGPCLVMLAVLLYMRARVSALVIVAGAGAEAYWVRGGSAFMKQVYVAALVAPLLWALVGRRKQKAAVRREKQELYDLIKRAVREALEEQEHQR